MLDLQSMWQVLVDQASVRVVSPIVQLLGVSGAAIDEHDIAASVVIAAIHVIIIAFVFRPLESWCPVERWSDRRLTSVDRLYTLLMLIGVLPVPIFIAMTPLRDLFRDGGSMNGGLLHNVQFFDRHPFLLWLLYYVVFDFVYYWMHRAEHAIPWWWALHSLHHSQRQVSCWTNDRDCFLSGLMEAGILASVGMVLGVEPSEFALLMLAGELLQNFSHANVRIGFGRVLGRVLVGPAFHRLHHMRADPARPGLHRCNFAQAFPIWDILFGTALYTKGSLPTGVTDLKVDSDNQRGLVGQQLEAVRRFCGAVHQRAGWVPGDVSFDENYGPIPDQ